MRHAPPWAWISLVFVACASAAPSAPEAPAAHPAPSQEGAATATPSPDPAPALTLDAEPAREATSETGIEPIAYTLGDCIRIEQSNPRDGAAEEERWLHEHYPGWQKVRGYLAVNENASGRSLDLLVIAGRDGSTHDVCFDITRFYGQF
ncbi:MAG: hypothetical protein U0X73_05540 [Thermoanaerobaculia bacterium]